MLSIYQVKEGRNILNDIFAKAYRSEMLQYHQFTVHTDYGIDFYSGEGIKTDSIPVMMPASAKHISSLVTNISSDVTELTEYQEVFAVSDDNILILFKKQQAEFNTIKTKMTNAKSALWYFNPGAYSPISVTVPATVDSGSYQLYQYNDTAWVDIGTVFVSSSKVTLTIETEGYYYIS